MESNVKLFLGFLVVAYNEKTGEYHYSGQMFRDTAEAYVAEMRRNGWRCSYYERQEIMADVREL